MTGGRVEALVPIGQEILALMLFDLPMPRQGGLRIQGA